MLLFQLYIYGQPKILIPFPPQVLHAENGNSVLFEIHLADTSRVPIEVLDCKIKRNSKVLYSNRQFIASPHKDDVNRYYKNIWLAGIETGKLVIEVKCKVGNDLFKVTREVQIENKKPLSILPPMGKGIWWAYEGPDSLSAHRTSFQKVARVFDERNNGFLLGYNNQRFATDWMMFGDENKLYRNDGRKNTDYYGFGQPVIAAAEGKVLRVKDAIPDNTPPGIDIDINLETGYGNCVVIDIGDSVIAYYAHLKVNSIKIREGDFVKKGDVIGAVGNSGISTAPHLQFELGKLSVPFGESSFGIKSQSISFVFDKYYHLGKALDSKDEIPVPAVKMNNTEKQILNKLPVSWEIIKVE